MHMPLPLCALAFATIGASLSDSIHLDRLGLTYVGILLALCLAAYSLDELHGRPYNTRFPKRVLWLFTAVGIFVASLVAIYLALVVSPYVLILAFLAGFFVFTYNMELFSGRFHNAGWFGVSWGGISTFGGYYVQAVNVTLGSLLVSAMASILSIGILQLTHKFRVHELSKTLNGKIQTADLTRYSRESRKIVWEVTKIQCYAMILLAAGLIAQKLL